MTLRMPEEGKAGSGLKKYFYVIFSKTRMLPDNILINILSGSIRVLWPKPPTEMTVVKLSYINLS